MTRSWTNFSWRAFFFAMRVIIGTWLALIAIMASHMAWLQMEPVEKFVNLQQVAVDSKPGWPLVVIQRTVREDVDVMVAAELRSQRDPSFQPCVSAFRSIADEAGSPEITVPLGSLLGNCDLTTLTRRGEPLVLQLAYTIELDYGIRKRAIATSEPFVLR